MRPYSNLRPFPPRPDCPPLAEPSIPRVLLRAVAVLGARNVLPPAARRRLELAGLPWSELSPILARVYDVDSWAQRFGSAADSAESNREFRRASSFAFLGQLILSPFHPDKARLRDQFRRCHVADRSANPEVSFERLVLCDGGVIAYRETPRRAPRSGASVVLLLPPLASTKEELSLLTDPLLDAGFTVVRMDLPGMGESSGPLQADSERRILRALDEIGLGDNTVIAGGISLGAHFALRLAALDPVRVRGAFGVSPPAVVTGEQWSRIPEIVYQYLDLYFATDTRSATYRACLGLTLTDCAPRIACPVRLYHAMNDRIAQPDARERFRAVLTHASLTDRSYTDRHGCLTHLSEIASDITAWADSL